MAQQPASNEKYYGQEPPVYPPAGGDPTYPQPPPAQQYPVYQPQPPPAYPQDPSAPAPPPPGPSVVVQQPQPPPQTIIVTNASVGPTPINMTCPHCQQIIVSRTTRVNGGCTWLTAGLLCLFGLWLCAWIPFVCDDCQNVRHTCPNCNNYLGTYNRL